MPHLPIMTWDFEDRLKATSKQTVTQGGSQIPEITYYVYNWQGKRVRTATESQAGGSSRQLPVKVQERLYLGDYEVLPATNKVSPAKYASSSTTT